MVLPLSLSPVSSPTRIYHKLCCPQEQHSHVWSCIGHAFFWMASYTPSIPVQENHYVSHKTQLWHHLLGGSIFLLTLRWANHSLFCLTSILSIVWSLICCHFSPPWETLDAFKVACLQYIGPQRNARCLKLLNKYCRVNGWEAISEDDTML